MSEALHPNAQFFEVINFEVTAKMTGNKPSTTRAAGKVLTWLVTYSAIQRNAGKIARSTCFCPPRRGGWIKEGHGQAAVGERLTCGFPAPW